MICTSVIPGLSSDLAKNDRVMSCLSYFPAFLAILKFWLFVENRGTNITPKQSNMIF